MVERIINTIDTSLDWIETKFGLVEHIGDFEKEKRPMKNIGNGEYKDVSFFDSQVSTAYWRLIEDVRQEKYTELGKDTYIRTYPLRLVIVAKKDGNDCTIEDEIFDKFMISVKGLPLTIKRDLGFNRVVFDYKGYVYNREVLADEEYTKDLRYRYNYFVIGININIDVHFGVNCLVNYCE